MGALVLLMVVPWQLLRWYVGGYQVQSSYNGGHAGGVGGGGGCECCL